MYTMFSKAFAAVLFLGALVAGSQAWARGASGRLGWPETQGDVSCFVHSSEGVTNNCTTVRRWVVPAIYDSNGSLTFRVAARGVNGTARRVRCQAVRRDQAGGSAAVGALASTVQLTGAMEELSSTISTLSRGLAYVVCDMDPSTRIHSVHY